MIYTYYESILLTDMKMKNTIFILAFLIYSFSNIYAQQDDPVKAAAGQLEAYNRQDIEGFLKWYSDDIEIYNFPDELVLKGKEKMRERYVNAWKLNPEQKAEVRERIVNGNTVIDKEHVTGRADGKDVRVIAVYRICNEKICRVYFIRD